MTEKIRTEIANHIAHVTINRPDKANALDQDCWDALPQIFQALGDDPEVRVIVLSGEGVHFCSGIDLSVLGSVLTSIETCDGRQRESLRKQIQALQASVNSIEACPKPVIASIAGACIGAGLDIISACDMRYGSADAFFSIKEIDMAMVADLGTLQRLPKLIPAGVVREMAYTARKVPANEAARLGLLNDCLPDRQALQNKITEVASAIASKSPLAIRGTKRVLNYSEDHSVPDGLEFVANWNAATLVSEDIRAVFAALKSKQSPTFKN